MTQAPVITQGSGSDDIRADMNSTPTGQHLLLGSFVLPFAEDPTGEVRGIEDGLTKCFIKSGQIRLAIFSAALGKWNVFGEESIGTIKAYAGDGSNLDTGWFLCDGANGTHNLLDKFILAGTFEEIGTEVEAEATAIDDHAALSNHVFTEPSTHTWVESNTGAPSSTTIVASGAGSTVASSSHLHTFDPADVAHTGASVDAHSAIDPHVVTQDYVPPSYTLAFIEKVA